ncbi:glycerophosphodiester phosphodiesterase [Microbacterium phage ValentiniPuff]|uniref:Glycerophosphodiester phosphodiesterase n=1 Tax=Microbacterium phage ValentiniPuff TaxID=2315705 RepID=A0A386KPT7_9CAUD|nr:glycerophosphodiester phosphodiesterase [Microbacterium phage ValentiniPuff]
MADAAVLGTSVTKGTSTSTPVDISAVPIGKWMLVTLMTSLASATFTPPAGWVVVKAIETSGTRRNAVWGKIRELGDGATATFTSSAASSQTFVTIWGDGKWADRVVGASRLRATVGASPRSQNIAPSIAATAGSVAIAISQEATTAQVATDEITAVSPSGWTRTRWVEQVPTTYIETVAVYTKPMPTAGATGDLTVTYSSTQDNNGWAVQIAIPADDPPAAPRRGFANVMEMLATFGATWAHRGGSATWPEMSEYAYDQAVLAGYPVLEFSAQRTSDGTWFGLHDLTLNRTSQTTGLPSVQSQTWSQVQLYSNSLNAGGTPRPYYRLIDFLDKYTPTHVVVVDPKDSVSRITEFLDILDAHGGPSKIVVKFFGTGGGSTALADAAKLRGYETWGYFYQAGFEDGTLDRDQSHWSILGMNYDASAPAWAGVTSYGKPVVGHIIGSQANYDTAISKGARMAQVAAVSTVAAVGPKWGGVAAGGSAVSGGAVGREIPAGTTVGGSAVTGAAVGSTSRSGTAVGASAVTGQAAGSAVHRGIASGSSEVSGSANGGSGHAGSAVGASAVLGAASGITTRSGAASGSVGSTGSAAGARASIGTAAGTVDVVGIAVGSRVSRGTGAGSSTVEGAAAGQRTSAGSAAGGSEITGIARGTGSASGTAAGSSTVDGAAAGRRLPVGSAAGDVAITGFGFGTTPRRGTAAGSTDIAGAALGSRPAAGRAVGGLVVTGLAFGTRTNSGTAAGGSLIDGTASGGSTSGGSASGSVAVSGSAAGVAPPRKPFPSVPRLESASTARPLASAQPVHRLVANP